MGRKPVNESDKKVRVSVSLPKWLADKLKSHKNFSDIVFKALLQYFREND